MRQIAVRQADGMAKVAVSGSLFLPPSKERAKKTKKFALLFDKCFLIGYITV